MELLYYCMLLREIDWLQERALTVTLNCCNNALQQKLIIKSDKYL